MKDPISMISGICSQIVQAAERYWLYVAGIIVIIMVLTFILFIKHG